MGDILFLILRRLRAPLITLIVVYAIAVGGLAVIPGIEIGGQRQPMTIFHAFYVMSYTATTIGFGEVPHPFSDAQRLWVTFAIYLSVIGWAYALGSVIALINDAPFRAMLARSAFRWRARGNVDPFYVVCGYGQSGRRVARSLDRLGNWLVVVDPDAERIARIAIEDYATPPLTLVADARLADVLEDCGVRSPHCIGLIALAAEDSVNQAIAIGARVLNPAIPIVACARSGVAQANLESFGGVTVINPFDTFAFNVGVALRAPEVLQVEDWLTGSPGSPCPACMRPPRGRWVLVGFGRFGRAIAKVLDAEGIEWRAYDPTVTEDRETRLLHGDYTEDVLHDAGIETADVLVAGADIDAVNLGATTRARRVKPDIFVIIRQNQMQDRALVDAARADMRFVQSEIIVHECLQALKVPMLQRFIGVLRTHGSQVAVTTLERVRAEVGQGSPRAWMLECDVLQPGMFHAFFQRAGMSFRIEHLATDPTNPPERMRVAALMLERDGTPTLLPPDAIALKPGDRVLFVGDDVARRLQQRYLTEPGTVSWVCTGSEPPRALVFRWLERRFRKPERSGSEP
ncbi:MAG: NAD-binding protein [Burkholderiales bacterium]|nr:NAD-binding protein [Burkholderiales bacterium]